MSYDFYEVNMVTRFSSSWVTLRQWDNGMDNVSIISLNWAKVQCPIISWEQARRRAK